MSTPQDAYTVAAYLRITSIAVALYEWVLSLNSSPDAVERSSEPLTEATCAPYRASSLFFSIHLLGEILRGSNSYLETQPTTFRFYKEHWRSRRVTWVLPWFDNDPEREIMAKIDKLSASPSSYLSFFGGSRFWLNLTQDTNIIHRFMSICTLTVSSVCTSSLHHYLVPPPLTARCG